MHAINRWLAGAALAAGVIGLSGLAGAQDALQHVQIPALGVVDLDEGTLECWVKLGFDPAEPHDGYRSRASLLHLDLADRVFRNDGLSLSLGTKDVGRRSRTGRATEARLGAVLEGREPGPPLFPSFGDSAQRDVWYHLAITWRGREMRAYVNGMQPGRGQDLPMQVYRRALKAPMSAAARLIIGNGPGRVGLSNMVAMDELRISSIARRPQELGFATGPLTVDPYTLLLVNFDNARDQSFQPVYAAVEAAGAAVSMVAEMGLVEGKFGKGLALNARAWAKD